MDNNRVRLLISVAKLYYLENKNQNEIANILGVSRPLISKYLMEARNLGIVKIEINDILTSNVVEDNLREELLEKYNLKDIQIVPASTNKDINDKMFVDYFIEYCASRYIDNSLIGIGWGSVIGSAIKKLDSLDLNKKILGEVVPIISNAPISYRNYHTNELVRMLCEITGLKGEYLYAPVICSSENEKDIFLNTDNVQNMFEKYEKLDYIVIQIRNFPSVPDLATEARFEKKLQKDKAVGMILGYYYDIEGNFITSKNDYSIQIPLDSIKKCKNVIGIINSRVNINATIGALKTGLFTHILISESLVKEI